MKANAERKRNQRQSAPIRDKFGRIVEIKPLELHANRWVPMQKLSSGEPYLPSQNIFTDVFLFAGDEPVYKAARGILNKLTPEKFAKLLAQFLELNIVSANLARQVSPFSPSRIPFL